MHNTLIFLEEGWYTVDDDDPVFIVSLFNSYVCLIVLYDYFIVFLMNFCVSYCHALGAVGERCSAKQEGRGRVTPSWKIKHN